MKRLIALLAALALCVLFVSSVAAADPPLVHSSRVLVSLNGDVSLPAGDEAGAVLVVEGDAVIEGTANVVAVVGGTATFHDARVETIFVANGRAEIDAGTTVLDGVRQVGSTVSAPSGVSITDMSGDLATFGLFIGTAALVLWIGWGLATLMIGLLVVALAARQLRTATDLIRAETGRVAVSGLLGLVVPPLVAVLAMVTLVGIPAGIGLLVVGWPMLAFAGYLVGALWIGEWLQGRRRQSAPASGRPYGAMLMGLLVAFVLGFVPLLTFLISFFGIGAVLLAAWRTVRHGGVPTAMPVAQPSPVAA